MNFTCSEDSSIKPNEQNGQLYRLHVNEFPALFREYVLNLRLACQCEFEYVQVLFEQLSCPVHKSLVISLSDLTKTQKDTVMKIETLMIQNQVNVF